MNTCGLPVDDVLISHAARMVLTLRYHKHISSEDRQLRVFWVIYALEKQGACHSRIASVSSPHLSPTRQSYYFVPRLVRQLERAASIS